MKRIYRHIFSLLLILNFSLFTLLANGANKYPFQESSPLASGKWVKVYLNDTGIYEISYSELIGMGFSDPSRVGVWGKGGTELPFSFTNGTVANMTDGLNPIRTLHRNNKIYFYGISTEDISFDSSTRLFHRNSRNIYSDYGAYFLSDSREPLLIEESEKPEDVGKEILKGYDYVYHEEDLQQNTTGTGQVYWGEDLLKAGATGIEWPISLPLMDPTTRMRLECRVFAEDKSSGSFGYGIRESTSGNRAFTVKHPSPASGTKKNPEFLHMNTPVTYISVPVKEFKLYNTLTNGKGSFINLDYWLLTYTKFVPDFSLTQSPQERLMVVPGNSTGFLKTAAGKDVVAFDVTTPNSVMLLPKEEAEENDSFLLSASSSPVSLIFCNLSEEQKRISRYMEVGNSDFHSLATKGADFVIVTLPEYKEFSEKLAELHRNFQNINVEVATIPELYNEFSGGIPDPMAIRSFIKMCYDSSDGRLKNALLVGKVFNNFRNVQREDKENEYIIGYQDNKVTTDTHAANAMDFYGMTSDFIYSSLQNNCMNVGIGLLPFHSKEEGENYLRKVEDYLSDKDKAAYVNEFLSLGGTGDNHTHDLQAVQIAELRNSYSPGRDVNTVLPQDGYGEKESKSKLIADWEYGKIFSSYFGHGTSYALDGNNPLFDNSELTKLKNSKPGFILICACDLSLTDEGKKGLGESIVTGTRHGMMASVMASRTVWSGQNFELARYIISSLYADPIKVSEAARSNESKLVYRKSSPTIGEVFAEAKTATNYSNSLNYLLIGDPALTIPVPLRHISVSANGTVAPGSKISIKGKIATHDSIHMRDTLDINSYRFEIDKSYTGKLVAKLMAPEKTVESEDYITQTNKGGGKTLSFPICDTRLSEYTAEVKKGEFELVLTLPEEISIYSGEKLRLFVSSYDYSQDLAASGCIELEVTEIPGGASNADLLAPSIACEFKNSERMLSISVSDDGSLPSPAVKVTIDGKPVDSFLQSEEIGNRMASYITPLDNMAEGEHLISIEATDMASNVSTYEETINISGAAPSIKLIADKKVTQDEIEFKIDSPISGNFQLIIADSKGNDILTLDIEDSSLIWSLDANNGTRINPGRYSARVAGVSTRECLYSNRYYFVVVE